LKQSLKALLEIKFPILISVESKFATYHHVVVVWREMVIDYESMYMYPLTEDTLRQICSVNTTFQQISCGYSLSILCSILLNFQASANQLRCGGQDFESSVLTTATYMHIANPGLDKGPCL
jgi:hypothetical protein